MGSSGHSHGGSYTPQPSWDELTPEQKKAKLEQQERARQYVEQARKERKKKKTKKIVLGIVITLVVIGVIIGLCVAMVSSCS